MMKAILRRIILFLIICQASAGFVFSGNDTICLGRSSGLQISGFARIDYIYDTRQTAEAVEGLFTFYPLKKEPDGNGKDINAAPKTNFISIASRLCTRFFAPDVFRAKSTAYLEFDFTGTSNTNGIRLRQAYVNLSWAKTNLLLGRTWHPLVADCFPNVIALNTGAPFWAFNRSDQLRFDYKPSNWVLSLTALYQSDYASLGPLGKSSAYMRNAGWPELNLGIARKTASFQTSVSGSMKTLKPCLYTVASNDSNYLAKETLTTFTAQAQMQYRFSDWVFKGQATYAQNMTESLMIGGYAVSEYDPLTGREKYTPTQYMNYWLNVDYGKKWQAGLFVGYLNSLGTLDNLAVNFNDGKEKWYAREPKIKYMYRISPHIFYNINNWQFAAELEYTVAAFGNPEVGNRARITNVDEVANFRTNLLVCFFF
jgi:hypothetical protein